MITWIQRLVFFVFQKYLGGHLIGGVRRQGLRVYFKAVNGLRRLLMVVAGLAVLIQLMTISFVGTIVSAAWIFIRDENIRLYVLCGGFALTFVLPLLGIYLLLSERFWMRLSGAGSLVEDSSV